MDTIPDKEPFRAVDPEAERKFREWLSSAEGRAEIADLMRKVEETIAKLREARKIPLYLLHTPMDF